MRKTAFAVLLTVGAVLGSATAAQAAAPSNDDIADAVVVTDLPFTDALNTSEATFAASDTYCGIATIWYQYTPAESGWVHLSTVGSDFDTMLGLYTGDPSALTVVECVDDTNSSLQAEIVAELTAGATYYISAGTCCSTDTVGQVGPGGDLLFTVETTSPALTAVTVALNRAGTVTRDGFVTVTGTVTCDQPAWADIYGSMQQRFNRIIARSDSATGTPCGPEPSTWTMQMWPYDPVLFGPGNADLRISAFAVDDRGESATFEDARTVHLRRSK